MLNFGAFCGTNHLNKMTGLQKETFFVLQNFRRYRSVRAIDTTVSLYGCEYRMALAAFVKPLASIGGHGFQLFITAVRASDF